MIFRYLSLLVAVVGGALLFEAFQYVGRPLSLNWVTTIIDLMTLTLLVVFLNLIQLKTEEVRRLSAAIDRCILSQSNRAMSTVTEEQLEVWRKEAQSKASAARSTPG